MSGRPILSGHCASADQTPNPRAAHERCKLDGCPCVCHAAPPEPPPTPRVKVSLRCLTGDHDGCPSHPGKPLSVIRTPCGCPDASHAAVPDDLEPAGEQTVMFAGVPVLTDPTLAPGTMRVEGAGGESVVVHLDQGHKPVTVSDFLGDAVRPATYDPVSLAGKILRPSTPSPDGIVTYDEVPPPALPDAAADGYAWDQPGGNPAADMAAWVAATEANPAPTMATPAWPDVDYDGTLTTHDRQRIAAAWLAYDLPKAYTVVETILREHGTGS